jgi:glycosyltransferase involved in cell wall biosynthesis
MVAPIGVDYRSFVPTNEIEEIPTIALTGNFNYYPNQQAYKWFEPIFARLRKRIPNVQLWVLGKGSDDILVCDDIKPAVKLWGTVENMADILARASLSVAPVFVGTGMQIKVIEALSCGVPVVASAKSYKPYAMISTDVLVSAANDRDFEEQCVKMLTVGEKTNLRKKAREEAILHFNWTERAEQLLKRASDLAPRLSE